VCCRSHKGFYKKFVEMDLYRKLLWVTCHRLSTVYGKTGHFKPMLQTALPNEKISVCIDDEMAVLTCGVEALWNNNNTTIWNLVNMKLF